MRLILFDIDGTLVSCGKFAARQFSAALHEVFGGHGALEGFSFAGKTDPMIARELMRAHGLDEKTVDAHLERLMDTFVAKLDATLEAEQVRILPGVIDLLEKITDRSDLAIGLLTGNWSGGARVKLGRVDLFRHFGFGAFGEDAYDRRGLVPVARERARALYGREFAPEDIVIVGDTALDIDCARAHGVPCLAVATGFTPAEALHEAGASWVLNDLRGAYDHQAFAALRPQAIQPGAMP
jgi:phosphoglycolate phosphatase